MPRQSRAEAEARGRLAEARAAERLQAEGWTILQRRYRSGGGEIDLVAERDGLLAFIEVKCRATLAEAAAALTPRQQARLWAAGEIWAGANGQHGRNGIRFDVIVVDSKGQIRRITDVIRQE
ncbi:YraN family protein [Roseomonas sp. 18066]|uniref:YraN family protein n=1 Tax=Roseomonas sp. 18066 TaxID=2681412 RepID=UPI001F3EAC85|nr:YraN family protein [Roseomonas sp. 18066]